MQNETPPTPPSQGGVFCSPPLARAGARFNTAPIQEKGVLNGDIKISSLDRARTREIEAAVNDAVALEYPHLLKRLSNPSKPRAVWAVRDSKRLWTCRSSQSQADRAARGGEAARSVDMRGCVAERVSPSG